MPDKTTIAANDPEVRAAYNDADTLAEFGEWCALRLFGSTPETLPEGAPEWCPVCHSHHVNPGEKTDAGRLTRPCPQSPADAVWNMVEA